MEIIIVGSGLLGVTTAYFLASEGHDVKVLERQSGPALETSYANGGLLTPSLANPWNEPGVLWQMLKWIGREDSPLLLRPRALPSLAFWGLSFLRHSSPERYRRNILRNTRLAKYNLRVMAQLREELQLSCEGSCRGTLNVFRGQAALDGIAKLAQLIECEGVAHRILDRQEVYQTEPALRALGNEVVGGIHFPDDEFGDARQFCSELVDAAKQKGVSFHFDTPVAGFEGDGARLRSVRTRNGSIKADAFVLAAGSYSPQLAITAGIRLPIRPCKGYSLTLPRNGWLEGPKIPVIDNHLHAAVTPLGDRLRVAGTAEFNGYDTELNSRRVDNLYQLLESIYPEFQAHLDRSAAEPWAGLRPVSASGVPIVGRSRVSNLYLNTGHGHLGWSMAAGSGKALASLICGQTPEIELQDYAV